MFDLNKDAIRIVNVNFRDEKHGDDTVLACDIKCEARMPNAVLTKFSPTLKDCLYTRADGATEDMLNPDHKPVLRNPLMGAISWGLEMPSTQFRVHHGENDDDDLVFSDCKAAKFKFTCQEGGTVVVGFRIQCHPDEADSARLLTMLNKTVKVSLIDETGESADDEAQQGVSSSQEGGLFDADDDGQSSVDGEDELYEEAMTFVVATQRASASSLQKKLHVGYSRASSLLEALERNGVISAQSENGKRQVLHQPAGVVAGSNAAASMSIE